MWSNFVEFKLKETKYYFHCYCKLNPQRCVCMHTEMREREKGLKTNFLINIIQLNSLTHSNLRTYLTNLPSYLCVFVFMCLIIIIDARISLKLHVAVGEFISYFLYFFPHSSTIFTSFTVYIYCCCER